VAHMLGSGTGLAHSRGPDWLQDPQGAIYQVYQVYNSPAPAVSRYSVKYTQLAYAGTTGSSCSVVDCSGPKADSTAQCNHQSAVHQPACRPC
jgi:hypothetical protein